MFDEKIVFDESLFQNKFFVKHFRVWSNNFSCLHRFPLFHQTGEEKTVNRITIQTFYIIIRMFKITSPKQSRNSSKKCRHLRQSEN